MRRLALLVLLCVASVALADTPAEGHYNGVFTNVDPRTSFEFVAIDGPPKGLVGNPGGSFNLNPETGVYVASNGDTWWFADGVAHFTHPLPFPAVGPFPSKDGPYWKSP